MRVPLYTSLCRERRTFDTPVTEACIAMEDLQEKMLAVDTSELDVMPESSGPVPPADIGTGPSGQVEINEPWEFPAEAPIRKSTIRCNLLNVSGNHCNDKPFGKWHAFRKHLQIFHDKENCPEWPKGKDTKPVGFEHMEEGSGPMVYCWSVLYAHFSIEAEFSPQGGQLRRKGYGKEDVQHPLGRRKQRPHQRTARQ